MFGYTLVKTSELAALRILRTPSNPEARARIELRVAFYRELQPLRELAAMFHGTEYRQLYNFIRRHPEFKETLHHKFGSNRVWMHPEDYAIVEDAFFEELAYALPDDIDSFLEEVLSK